MTLTEIYLCDLCGRKARLPRGKSHWCRCLGPLRSTRMVSASVRRAVDSVLPRKKATHG